MLSVAQSVMMTMSLEFLSNLSSTERDAVLYKTPAMRPPSDAVPNFENPESWAYLPTSVTAVCLAISSICVLLRAYSRVVCQRMVGVEDGLGLIAFGFFLYTAQTMFQLSSINVLGVHQWNVRLSTFGDFLFGQYMLSSCYTLVLLFGKPAVILEWIRIFVPSGTRNKFFWLCWIMIIANILIYSGLFVAVQFYCEPHKRIWMRWIPGTCVERRRIDSPSAIFNLVVDIVILALPQGTIWNLQVSKQRRFGISFVFSLGLLCIAAATGRLYEAFTFDYDHDVTWQSPKPFLWVVAECTCVLVVFCVPSIPRVFVDSRLRSDLTVLSRSISALFVRRSQTSHSSKKVGRSWLASSINKASPHATRGAQESAFEAGESQVHLADLEAARSSSRATNPGIMLESLQEVQSNGTMSIATVSSVSVTESEASNPMSSKFGSEEQEQIHVAVSR